MSLFRSRKLEKQLSALAHLAIAELLEILPVLTLRTESAARVFIKGWF